MELINLTPHAIVLDIDGTLGGRRVVRPSGVVARVMSTPGRRMDYIDDAPVVPVYTAPIWGAVDHLPPPAPGKLFIVSALVAARCAGRRDVVSPGTGPHDNAVRDADGRLIAVTRLISLPTGEEG